MKRLYAPKTASRGIVTGKVYVKQEVNLEPCGDKIPEELVQAEVNRFLKTKEEVKAELEVLAEKNEIFGAHLMMADDFTLEEGVVSKIRVEYLNAELALSQTVEEIAAIFDMMDDAYMKERAADVKDVGKRFMANLKGVQAGDFSDIQEPVILVARDLFPSDTARLNLEYIKGFITQEGGVTSHVSIMAKGIGLPALVGVEGILEAVDNGTLLCMDASTGEIFVEPDEETLAEYRTKQQEYESWQKMLEQVSQLPAETTDGRRVSICGNVGNVEDVQNAVNHHVDGIGLFRSEFLYMESSHFPTEEEQFEVYRKAAELCPEELTIRTLDIGGDKELPYYEFDEEENPFLGWRAIRISLDMKEMFKTQLRAILRASAFGTIRIMFPMIISVEELRGAKAVLEECKAELAAEGIDFDAGIQAGMMIETPASVLMAEELAEEADFFSIGTNDLTQYLLAVDRGNKRISGMYNSFHPAVLRAIAKVIRAGHAAGIKVGMCGEFASDAKASVLLLGMGLDEFSMSSGEASNIRYTIRNLSYARAQEKAGKVQTCRTIEEVMGILG
ncbi:MAG: phosphoenolpyruvate--protein phosphotransferase [Lachnospiraceae bacterium]|nr:phosphoenolpyruvate--protein phosphotransferase [Lachnospiraceae bacterium]